jgi:hypothetical protein
MYFDYYYLFVIGKICRVGKKEDTFHCQICKSCILKAGKDIHPCRFIYFLLEKKNC